MIAPATLDVAAQARWYACSTCEDVSWFDADPTCFVCGSAAAVLHHQPHLKDPARLRPALDEPEAPPLPLSA